MPVRWNRAAGSHTGVLQATLPSLAMLTYSTINVTFCNLAIIAWSTYHHADSRDRETKHKPTHTGTNTRAETLLFTTTYIVCANMDFFLSVRTGGTACQRNPNASGSFMWVECWRMLTLSNNNTKLQIPQYPQLSKTLQSVIVSSLPQSCWEGSLTPLWMPHS